MHNVVVVEAGPSNTTGPSNTGGSLGGASFGDSQDDGSGRS